jgi:hypothetical protein
MSNALAEFISKQEGDSTEFVDSVRALAMGIARDCRPARLYVVRIDNWFGPHWLHFSGKFIGALAVYQNKDKVTVPPFIPRRVVAERVFVGPTYEETLAKSPLHLDCTSKQALLRYIAEIDKDAAFLWFSSESESQKRGSVMIYLPVSSEGSGFYAGFSEGEKCWEPVMLRGISRSEIVYLAARGQLSAEPINA